MDYVYLEKRILVYYFGDFQNYRENLIFLLLLICQNIELCPGPHAQENLSDISKLRGIKLAHQNIMGLLNKKTYIINFVYK